MAWQERGAVIASSPGTTTSISPGDTNTVELDLTGSTLTGLIPTTATPQVANVGVATAATTDAITVGTFSGQMGLVDNNGDQFNAFTGTSFTHATTGRWTLSQGTDAAPYQTEQPTVLINRTQRHNTPTHNQAEFDWHCALGVNNRTSANASFDDDETMCTGVGASAHQYSNSTLRADAAALVGLGAIHGSTPGSAFGAYLEARTTIASGKIVAIETQTRAAETSPADRTFSPTSLIANTMHHIQMQSYVTNDATKLGGTGLLFYRSNSSVYAQFDVGIGFMSQNSPIRNVSIYDASAAARSLYITNLKSTAAIEVTAGAGQINFGSIAGWLTKTVIRPDATTDSALVLHAITSQSETLFRITNAANATVAGWNHQGRMLLGISSLSGRVGYINLVAGTTNAEGIDFGGDAYLYRSGTNYLRIDNNLNVNNKVFLTGGGAIELYDSANAYIETNELSAAPSTPASDRVRYYASADTVSGTSTVRPSNTILRSKDDAGAIRTLLASLGDGSPVYQTPMQNTFAGSGTLLTPTAGQTYWTALQIAQPCVMTGIRVVIGTQAAGGAHNIIVILYDANGKVVANSALAGTDVSGTTAGNWIDIPFTATKRISQPGTYYPACQFGTAPTTSAQIFRYTNGTANLNRVAGSGNTATGTFGTLIDPITPLGDGSRAPLIGTY
jgi:hypothetical protein